MNRSLRAPRAILQIWAAVLLATVWPALMAQAATAQDYLPVDRAFAPSAAYTDDGDIAVRWQIADAYYLYRHALGFAAEGAALGEPQIPDGERHSDEFFGPVETYRQRLEVVVPVAGDRRPETIEVQYQGCADAGLCYPPQTRKLNIDATGSGADAAPDFATTELPRLDGPSEATSSTAPRAPQQNSLAARLADAALLPTLAAFFGFGLLLAFTPCILPMIPILSGLIVGAKAGPRRALALSLVYVLAMAAAYTVFGVIAGYFGANLQAALQMPAVLLPFAAVFALLALAAFGAFEIAVPSGARARLGAIGTRRGGLVGAALMGFFSALIAGPCLAPPLVGALLYISSSGDALIGGAALFMLGLGMGMPLIAIGAFGAGVLPRLGPWMSQARVLSGVVLLAVAIWLLGRILPAHLSLAAWGLLALGYGAYLSTLATGHRFAQALQRASVFVLFVYAGAAGLGLMAGAGSPLRPLAGLTAAAGPGANAGEQASPFTRVADLEELNAALDSAARAGRPAVVDFYADWCVECVQMEHGLFAEPEVREALSEVAALQVDVTDYTAADRALMRELEVFGPPSILFYGRDGAEVADLRRIGKIDAAAFIDGLERAARSGERS